MLSPTLATWRILLHVLAAAIWVGGQFVLLATVKDLRKVSDDSVKAAANAFSRLAWPAFAVLVLTGIWNLVEIRVTELSTTHQITIFVKVAVALLSGFGAAVHQFGTSKAALAIGGALGGLGAIAAVYFGILIRTGIS